MPVVFDLPVFLQNRKHPLNPPVSPTVPPQSSVSVRAGLGELALGSRDSSQPWAGPMMLEKAANSQTRNLSFQHQDVSLVLAPIVG